MILFVLPPHSGVKKISGFTCSLCTYVCAVFVYICICVC